MNLSLKYLDTCLPDYFQGYGGQVLAVPINGKMRCGEVLKGLLDEVHSWSGYLPQGQAHSIHYDQLEQSAIELFESTDKRKTFSKHASDEWEDVCCYAYFGIVVSMEDEEE